MDHPTFQQGPSSRRPTSPLDRHGLDIFDELRRVTVSLREEEHSILLPTYRGVVGLTKAAGRFNERLQYRLEIEGRAADNFQHVGGGGLLLQRLSQLVEQTRVLDCNHRLRGEVLHQFNLLVGERPHLLPVDGDRAEQHILLEHRYREVGEDAADIDAGHHPWIALEIRLTRPSVLDLHRPLGPDDLGVSASWMGTEWHVLPPCRRYVVNRSVTKYVPVIQVQRAELGTTEPSRVREHGLEHRLQLARRAANDTEDLGCRSLLLERLGELARARLHLVEQPHALDGDHRLVGKRGDQFDLLVGERLDGEPREHEHADRLALAQHRDRENGAVPAARSEEHTSEL